MRCPRGLSIATSKPGGRKWLGGRAFVLLRRAGGMVSIPMVGSQGFLLSYEEVPWAASDRCFFFLAWEET